MKRLVLLALSIGIASFATGCGRQCQQAQEQILVPAQEVVQYLKLDPSGEDLAVTGCVTILEKLKHIPEGAELIRQIAKERFTHTYSRCIYWGTQPVYKCQAQPYPQRPICYTEQKTYCAKWDTEMVRDANYSMAIQLSQDLDAMHTKSHHMCGNALAGNFSTAYEESKEILSFIESSIQPQGEKFYGLACGT